MGIGAVIQLHCAGKKKQFAYIIGAGGTKAVRIEGGQQVLKKGIPHTLKPRKSRSHGHSLRVITCYSPLSP